MMSSSVEALVGRWSADAFPPELLPWLGRSNPLGRVIFHGRCQATISSEGPTVIETPCASSHLKLYVAIEIFTVVAERHDSRLRSNSRPSSAGGCCTS